METEPIRPGSRKGAPLSHAAKRGRPDNLARFNKEQAPEIATPITQLEFARIDDPDWFMRAQTLVYNMGHEVTFEPLGFVRAMIARIVANIEKMRDLPIGNQFMNNPKTQLRFPNLKVSGIRRERAIGLSKALLAVTKENPDLVRRAVIGYLYAVDERMHVLLTGHQYSPYGRDFINVVDQITTTLDSHWLTWRLIGFEVDGERKDPRVWLADLGLDSKISVETVEFIKPVTPHNRAELDHLRIDVCVSNGQHRLSREFYEVIQLAAVTELWASVRSKHACEGAEAGSEERHDLPASDTLPELSDNDNLEELKTMIRSLLLERSQARHRAEEQERQAAGLEKHAENLYRENQHLQAELDRLRKTNYVPPADRRIDTRPPNTEQT